jgi:hypothetical protein
MPDFNVLHINEELIGRVIKAKKNDDSIYVSDEEKKEMHEIYRKSKKDSEKKNIIHIALEKITGRNIEKFKNSKGSYGYRFYNESDEYNPVIKLLRSTERPKGESNEIQDIASWITDIKKQKIDYEDKIIQSKENNKELDKLINVYSAFIDKKMMQTF